MNAPRKSHRISNIDVPWMSHRSAMGVPWKHHTSHEVRWVLCTVHVPWKSLNTIIQWNSHGSPKGAQRLYYNRPVRKPRSPWCSHGNTTIPWTHNGSPMGIFHGSSMVMILCLASKHRWRFVRVPRGAIEVPWGYMYTW